MKGTIFKVVKAISSVLGSYLWLIYLTVMALVCLFRGSGKLELPSNLVGYFDKALILTLDYYDVILYSSIVSVILVILLSNANKVIKVCVPVGLMIYLLMFPSIYDKMVTTVVTEVSFTEPLMINFINLIGFVLVTVLLELLKSATKVNKLTYTEKTIKHKKVDELVKEYYSKDTEFNMSLCEELIKKYGGAR